MKKITSMIVAAFMAAQMIPAAFAAPALPTLKEWGNDENGLLPSEFAFIVNENDSELSYKFSLYKDNSLVHAQTSEFHGEDITGDHFKDFGEEIIENGPGNYSVKIGILEKSADDYGDYDNTTDIPVLEETEMSEVFKYTAPTKKYQKPTSLSINNNILSYKYFDGERTYHNVGCYAQYPNGEEFFFHGRGGGGYKEVDITEFIETFNKRVASLEQRDSVKYDRTKAKMLIKVVVRPLNVLSALPSDAALIYVDGVVAEPKEEAEEPQIVPETEPTTEPQVTPEAEADAEPTITVTYDGSPIEFDQPPVIENGRTLVPLRAIFETLGATVEWDGETRSIAARKGGTIIRLTVDSTKATVNGEQVGLDVPAKVINDRTLVPVRFIADCFGVNVDWDQEALTVILTTD